ncbi:MAG: hypothetical protein KDA85_05370, partial [Planctomycetaceae bacterium]|nr:hypothetical protein [Planctomycetaceae bacterium]
LLIWHGRRSFIDSRVQLFGRLRIDQDRYNDQSIAGKYAILRQGLLRPPAQPDNPESMSDPNVREKHEADLAMEKQRVDKLFQAFQITHVMPRLSPPEAPDYVSVAWLGEQNLAAIRGETSDCWFLISVGPSAAVFEHRESRDPLSLANSPEMLNPLIKTFRELTPADVVRIPASKPDFYQRHVYRTRRYRDAHNRLSEHYLQLASNARQTFLSYQQMLQQAVSSNQLTPEQGGQLQRFDAYNRTNLLTSLAGAYLAIRESNLALQQNPNDGDVWKTLATAYSELGGMENIFGQAAVADPTRNLESLRHLRFVQAVSCYRQALVSRPDDQQLWYGLWDLYLSMNKTDLAAECLGEWLALSDETGLNPEEEELRQQYELQLDQLRSQVDQATAEIEQLMTDNPAPEDPQERTTYYMEAVTGMVTRGLTREAIRILEDHGDEILTAERDVILGTLLLDVGDLQESQRVFAIVEQGARDRPEMLLGSPWEHLVAISRLQSGEFEEAEGLWEERFAAVEQQRRESETLAAQVQLVTLPMVSTIERAQVGMQSAGVLGPWPYVHTQMVNQDAAIIPNELARLRFLMAISNLEHGDVAQARLLLTSIIQEGGDSPFASMARVYLPVCSADAIDVIAKYSPVPAEQFPFEVDEAETTP